MGIGKNQPGCCCVQSDCPECGYFPCRYGNVYMSVLFPNGTTRIDLFRIGSGEGIVYPGCQQWINSPSNTVSVECDKITGLGWRLRVWEYGSFVRYYFSTGTIVCNGIHFTITLPANGGGNYVVGA